MRVFKKKGNSPKITRIEALKSTPVRNTKIKEARLETGEVTLSYPATIRPRLAGLFRRLGGEIDRIQVKKLQLDELGTTVWDLIDGNRSVRQIIQEFSKKYQLQSKEAEVSVTQFLRDLGKRGIIGMK